MRVRPFSISDEPGVIALWQECRLIGGTNDPHADIRRKLRVDPALFLVGERDTRIVATVMAGYEGHRGWINYLAVAPDLRRTGLAGQMLAEAENRLRALGCPKINLQVRRSNLEAVSFYRHLGYVEDEVVNFGKRLVHDEPPLP